MRYLLLYAIVALTLMQCASPKNACIDITSIDQKHERLPRKYSRNIDNKKSPLQLESQYTKSQQEFSLDDAFALYEDEVYPSLLSDELIVADLSNRKFSRQEKKIQSRLKALQEQLAAADTVIRISNGDTTIVNSESNKQPDLFDLQHRKAKRQGLASFWLAIGTVLPVIGIASFVASIVFGFKSLKSYKKSINKEGRGWAVAGLVIDALYVFLILLVVVLLIAWLSQGGWD
ncbi:MAG: DUF4190 domain-containing protein [Cyclobacteriaceae bacterium]